MHMNQLNNPLLFHELFLAQPVYFALLSQSEFVYDMLYLRITILILSPKKSFLAVSFTIAENSTNKKPFIS